MEAWKTAVQASIQDRNGVQGRSFEFIITNCTLYLDSQLLKSLKDSQAKGALLERENILLKKSGGYFSHRDPKHVQELEDRVRELEGQLGGIYKDKSENVSALLTLREEKDALVLQLDQTSRELKAVKSRLLDLELEWKESEDRGKQLEEVRLVLSSELVSIKGKLDKVIAQNQTLSTENDQLIARMVKMKEDQAKQMNEINEYYESVVKQQKAVDTLRASHGVDLNIPVSEVRKSLLPKGYKYRIVGHERDISACVYNDGGTVLFTAGGDSTLRMWDPIQGQEKKQLRGLVQPALSLDVSAGTEFVLAGSTDNTALVWNFSLGRVKHTLTGHSSQVTSVKFFNGKKWAATGSQDRTIKIWDLERGFSNRTMTTFSSCHCVTLTPEDSILGSGHFDGHVRLWSSRNGEIIHDLPVHDRPVTSLIVSPDGTRMVTNSLDSTLCLINLKKFQAEGSLTHPDYHCQQSYSKICFSFDGKYVLAGGSDGKVYVWNMDTLEIEEVYEGGHTNAITCVNWRPNSSQFSSVDTAGGLVIWE